MKRRGKGRQAGCRSKTNLALRIKTSRHAELQLGLRPGTDCPPGMRWGWGAAAGIWVGTCHTLLYVVEALTSAVNSDHTAWWFPISVLVPGGQPSAGMGDDKVNTTDTCKCINQGLLPYFVEGSDKRVVK